MTLFQLPMSGDQTVMLGVHAVLVAMVGWLARQLDKLEKRVEHRMDRLEDALWKTPPRATHLEDFE